MSRTRWRVALWATTLAVVVLLAWSARSALLPFAMGALLAYILTPLVDRLASLVPARSHRANVYRRGAAVVLVYAMIGAVLFALGAWLIPVATDQVLDFSDKLPESVTAAREQMSEWLTQYRMRVPADVQDRLDTYAEDAGLALAEAAAAMVRRSVGALTGTIGVVFGFLVVPFWMFYALRDRHNIERNFMAAPPERLRADLRNVLSIADRLLGRYLRAQLVLGVVVGVAVGAGLTLMDIQMSLALGVIAGVTELIPLIGPWIGAVPGMMVVAGTNPDMVIWVGLLYLLVQQAENNLLVPRIQGQAVQVHPAMVILLLVVGGAVFGFIGLVVIVPATAILRELFWYADRRLSGASAAEAFALTHVGQVAAVHAPGANGNGAGEQAEEAQGVTGDTDTARPAEATAAPAADSVTAVESPDPE